ncbi:unnamed protein product [Paramecium primaurelia]|uniref:WD40-repeat-containing domain n=1 Tax=Paramecium primaurelia TaxID=5886 RepID=A0A8S1L9G0_PARPR|nr:unnamed protein product [Paramecium primaurelia]
MNEKNNFQIPHCNINDFIQLKPNLNSFTFELMNSIKQNTSIYAIAFSKDNSIVLTGSEKDIKVFKHNQGILNQIQLLIEHKQYVYTLIFMNNTNNFVSGSYDHTIIIWQLIENNYWKCQQKLKDHSSQILCLIVNNTDDLIISGSGDKKIKFWTNQNYWFCLQSITDHTDYVYSLSLNEKQNKLLSCSADSKKIVIELQKSDRKWYVIQKIEVEQYGYRLCFINDNQFIFQPYCKEYTYVYEMDKNTRQFMKTKEIAVKCGQSSDYYLFPQQYLKSKSLLVNKNARNINIIQKKDNGDFIINQPIEFDTYYFYGQLSNDGEYLIVWDDKLKEIQIRKRKEL